MLPTLYVYLYWSQKENKRVTLVCIYGYNSLSKASYVILFW
jgi:hypothetical protein